MSPNEAAEFDVDTPTEESLKQKPGKVEKLTNWFDGASEPLKISLVPSPSKEKLAPLLSSDNMSRIFSAGSESVDNLTKRPQKGPIAPSHRPSQSVGRFSFFRKPSQSQSKPDPIPPDELANFDVHTALFPSGLIDEFSPAAFKNLQMNAEGTVRRLQNAYRENLHSIQRMTSEKNIQADELDATRMRNEHLKLQLTEMAERAVDQEKTIEALRTELEGLRTVRMVATEPAQYPGRAKTRGKRSSDVSTLNESESGSELSSAMSVFSEAQSASESMSSPGTSVAASPVLKSAVLFRPQFSCPDQGALVRKFEPIQVLQCQKCHGAKPDEAWEVISVMKAESLALKNRIEELEGAQSDALNFLSAIGVAS